MNPNRPPFSLIRRPASVARALREAAGDSPHWRYEAERNHQRRDEVEQEQGSDRRDGAVEVDVVLLEVVDADCERRRCAEIAHDGCRALSHCRSSFRPGSARTTWRRTA